MVKALAFFLTGLWAGVASADCRLALLLALDVSSSVDADEYALQRSGVAAALRDPDVQSAILMGGGHVALAVYEWSGRRQSSVVLGWTALTDAATLEQAVSQIEMSPRSHTRFPTAMGYALGFGATLMERGPACARRVIDVSGDGINNDGFGPENAYRHFPFRNITVNGLAVLGADPLVEWYYETSVLHGPNAFLETADGFAGYRRAMTRKLYREINNLVIGDLAPPGMPPG